MSSNSNPITTAISGASRILNSTVDAIGKGDFNNFGNTLAESTAATLTGGATLAAGYKAGENNVDRAQSEAASAAANANQADTANQQALAIQNMNNRVDAVGKSIATTPGRRQTLLTGNYGQPGNGGTLLTTTGSK